MPSIQVIGIMPLFWNLRKDVPQEQRFPWVCEEWRKRTAIPQGLFPAQAHQLPAYLGWNQPQIDSVRALFNKCSNLTSDGMRTTLSSRGSSNFADARRYWSKAWDSIWKKAGGNEAIDDLLRSHEYHPHDIMRADLDNGTDPEFPVKPGQLATLYNDIAETIFGVEVLLQKTVGGGSRLNEAGSQIIDILMTHAWHRYDSLTKRMRKKVDKIERGARKEYQGE